jgi:hypothetical protein
MMIYKDISLGVDPPASNDSMSGEGFDHFKIFNHMKTRRKSSALDVAKSRWSGLVSIDPQLDLGNGMGAVQYKSSIDAVEAKLMDVMNKAAEMEAVRAELRDMERELNDMSDLYQRAVSVKFGYNSSEYMAAGGTRKKDRRRPVRLQVSSPA